MRVWNLYNNLPAITTRRHLLISPLSSSPFYPTYLLQLFGGDSPYEDDDREADKIYQAIDDRMDARRKRRYVCMCE